MSPGFPFLFLLLAGLVGCATPPRPGPALPRIEGKVSVSGKGVSGAEVLLYPATWRPEADWTPVGRAVSGENGWFVLEAPAGRYLVVARTPGRFAYFGRNPVRLFRGLSGLHLPLVPAHPLERARVPAGREGIEGRVLADGGPLSGARVFVYLDPQGGLRGPGYAVSEPTGADGRFVLDLPPGTYFLAARRRRSPGVGALHPGDRFGVLPHLPVRLGRGERIRVAVETVELPSAERMARFRAETARLSGRIVDPAGRPLAGMRACLYRSPQMLDRPEAFSEPTGHDGRFVLETSAAGVLYLGARERLGGPPDPRERVGFYRGPQGARIRIRPGDRVGNLLVVVPGGP